MSGRGLLFGLAFSLVLWAVLLVIAVSAWWALGWAWDHLVVPWLAQPGPVP